MQMETNKFFVRHFFIIRSFKISSNQSYSNSVKTIYRAKAQLSVVKHIYIIAEKHIILSTVCFYIIYGAKLRQHQLILIWPLTFEGEQEWRHRRRFRARPPGGAVDSPGLQRGGNQSRRFQKLGEIICARQHFEIRDYQKVHDCLVIHLWHMCTYTYVHKYIYVYIEFRHMI